MKQAVCVRSRSKIIIQYTGLAALAFSTFTGFENLVAAVDYPVVSRVIGQVFIFSPLWPSFYSTPHP